MNGISILMMPASMPSASASRASERASLEARRPCWACSRAKCKDRRAVRGRPARRRSRHPAPFGLRRKPPEPAPNHDQIVTINPSRHTSHVSGLQREAASFPVKHVWACRREPISLLGESAPLRLGDLLIARWPRRSPFTLAGLTLGFSGGMRFSFPACRALAKRSRPDREYVGGTALAIVAWFGYSRYLSHRAAITLARSLRYECADLASISVALAHVRFRHRS